MLKINNKKNYLLTICSSFGGKILSIILSFISVPISLNYWGETRYAMFTIINSIIVYLSISNLGLTIAASVLMAKSNNFNEKIKILKRSLYMIILSITIFSILFLLLDKHSDRWVYLVGKIPQEYFKEIYDAMYIMVLLFFVNTIFSLIDSALNGFYKLYVQKYFGIFFSLFSFGSLLLTIHIKGELYHFVLFIGIVKLIFSILKIIYFYYFIYKDAKNEFKGEIKINNESSYKNIFITGIRFFLIGITGMVVWNTDNLVIGHFINIKSVTSYAITFKIYSIIFTSIAIINSSILPLFSKEFSVNNWEWINKTYERLLKIMAILGGLFWISGTIFLKDIIYLWAGEKGYAGLMVVFALGGYSYLLSMVNINSGIANAFNYTKGVVWVGAIEALINFTFSMILLKFLGLGGIAIGTFLGSLLGPTLFLPMIIVKYSSGKIKYDFKFILIHFIKIVFPMLIFSLILQFFISDLIIKILLGLIIIIIYLFLSLKLLPNEIKFFLRKEIKLIIKRPKLLTDVSR